MYFEFFKSEAEIRQEGCNQAIAMGDNKKRAPVNRRWGLSMRIGFVG